MINTDENSKPIALTDDIFYKAGFDKDSFWGVSFMSLGDISFGYHEISKGVFLCTYNDNDGTYIKIGKEIKYLHEIQELYLIISGNTFKI